jgi:hypothetical protein
MTDVDLPLAESAYTILLDARHKSRGEAANLVRPLRDKTQNKGARSREVEIVQADAWLAIWALSKSLETEIETSDDIWLRAISRTEEWRNSIS